MPVLVFVVIEIYYIMIVAQHVVCPQNYLGNIILYY